MKTTIDIAQEIAAQYNKAERFQTWTHDFMMQRLMELVTVSAAAEREACAKLCDELANDENTDEYINGADWCSVRIRARGNT